MTLAQEIAARTLYGEARAEPEEGQRAVARVLVNRMRDGRWGKNLWSVCLWPFQFSCWLPRDPNLIQIAMLPAPQTPAAREQFKVRPSLINIDQASGYLGVYSAVISSGSR